MTREEWRSAQRLARIARRRGGEGAGPEAMPAPLLGQDVRRLARHAAILSRASRAPPRLRAAPVPRTRPAAAFGLFLMLILALAALARREAGPVEAPRVMQADAPAPVQAQAPDALPTTQPA